MAILSLGIGDMLILSRVIALWDKNKVGTPVDLLIFCINIAKLAVRWMFFGFGASFIATLCAAIITLLKLYGTYSRYHLEAQPLYLT